KFVHDSEVLQGLFSDLGPRYSKRAGGYTRILKVAENRKGDNSEMALITLVEDEISPRKPAARAPKAKVPSGTSAKKTAEKKKVDITKSEAKADAPESPTAE